MVAVRSRVGAGSGSLLRGLIAQIKRRQFGIVGMRYLDVTCTAGHQPAAPGPAPQSPAPRLSRQAMPRARAPACHSETSAVFVPAIRSRGPSGHAACFVCALECV